MGWLKKIAEKVNEAQQEAIHDVQQGVEHATSEAVQEINNNVIEPIQQGIEHAANEAIGEINKPVDAVYEAQKDLIKEAQDKAEEIIVGARKEAEKIINDARTMADNMIKNIAAELTAKKDSIIEGIFWTICATLKASAKWYLRLIGFFMESLHVILLKSVKNAVKL